MNVPPMVSTIISLRPFLPPISDELRKRVQSIRVRSVPEVSGTRISQDKTSWRNKQGASPISTQKPQLTGNWRNSTGNLSQSSSFRFGASGACGSPCASAASDNSPKLLAPDSPVVLKTPGNPWNGSAGRYVSKFHNGSKPGDDKILKTVIQNKLNVFSIQTYDDVKQFLFQILGSDQKEFIREFTWMVFRKAASENKFCGLYAKLLSEIKQKYPVIMEEMRKLHTTYLDIWKITENTDATIDKRYRLGYSQFLAELSALGIIEPETMMLILNTLRGCIMDCIRTKDQIETIDEYMNCLKQLCNSKTTNTIKNLFNTILKEDLEFLIKSDYAQAPGLSQRSRFACMDINDLLEVK